MTTKFILACFLAVALLGIAGQRTIAQEVAPDECYEGVTTTSYAVYDPDVGEYAEIRLNCLPWWWEPGYLPPGWVVLTPAIVPAIWYEAAFVGGVVSFGAFHYHHGFEHLRGRFHGHFGNFRGQLHGRFNQHFRKGMATARGKYPGLKKPPSFQHSGRGAKGRPETGKPGSHPGAKQSPGSGTASSPGKGGPPTTGKPSPPAPPNKHAAPSPSAKLPPPAKGGAPGQGPEKAGPPPKASGQKLPPPAKSASSPSGYRPGGAPGYNQQQGGRAAPATRMGQPPATGGRPSMGQPRGGNMPRPQVSGSRGGGSKPQPQAQPQRRGK